MYRIGKEEKEACARVIDSKNLFKINSGLCEAQHFEEELKEKLGTSHAILMTSGKAALISALTALGVGPGDEVIVPAYTYIATAIAVTAVGAIPVICEVDETLTMSAADVEKKISSHTRAIIPVHIQGFPCDMDALTKIARRHGLFIVEDACQADGGSYKGKRLGTIGEAGALSFNHFKVITAGEGGALLTDNKTLYDRAMIFHDSSAIAFFGDQLKNVEEKPFCGLEFRTNEITAAILREQLKKLGGILGDLRRIKKTIMDEFDPSVFAPSHDIEGDCGTTIPFRFESEEAARKFALSENIGGTLPIDTGKHVYKNWTPIMQKRGAFHPLMDPFKMEANKDIVPDYSPDMCPKTLELLSRTVYVSLHPDMTEADVKAKIADIRKALEAAK